MESIRATASDAILERLIGCRYRGAGHQRTMACRTLSAARWSV